MASPTQSFVNQARNVCWLSGAIKRLDPTTVLICSSNDATRGYHVTVRRGLMVPPDGSIVEVNCHLYGTHNKDTNTRGLRVEAIYFKRASLGAMPKKLALFQPFVSRDNPLPAMADVKQSIHRMMARADVGDEVGNVDALVDSMVRESQKGGRIQPKFTNKVIITGFVGAKAVRQASETEDAHLYAQIHQFPDTERALPVKVYGNVSSLSQAMRTLFPVNMVGELAFTDTTGEGGIVTRSYYIKVAKPNDVGSAQPSDFQNRTLPVWWVKAFAAHQQKQEAAKAASGNGPKTVKAAAVPPAAAEGVDPDLADV
jgi:hypothetical protein